MADDFGDITHDTLLGGRLICCQHRQGYRFSIDAILLARFSLLRPDTSVLDLGAGSGVVGILAAFLQPSISLTFYELQPSLVALIRRNITENNLMSRCIVVPGDVRQRQGLQPESMDLVVCNPPYGKLHSGRLNPGSEQAIARHELQGTLVDFVQCAAFSVKNKSRVAFVYPARRLPFLLSTLQQFRLQPKRLRLVHSYPGSVAKLLLVEAVKNGGEELEVLPPLFIYQQKDGEYNEETAEMLGLF